MPTERGAEVLTCARCGCADATVIHVGFRFGKEHGDVHTTPDECITALRAQLTALQSSRDAAERDRERLDWLSEKAQKTGRDGGWWGYWELPPIPGWNHTPYAKTQGDDHDYPTLRAAIDAARGSR